MVRRRRENHNEIEKRRREQQRQQLEVLRQQIPKLQAERTSTVGIITSAIDYIQLLKFRLRQLERVIKDAGLVIPPANFDSSGECFITVPADSHMMAGSDILTILQIQGSANRFSGNLKPQITPTTSPSATPKKRLCTNGLSQEFDPTQHTIDSTGSIKQRRDSAMLLPTNDPNTFLFGKRDSLQNFFAGPLPSFDETIKNEFCCTKCRRGVENLIMVDCDTCHSWYHIRCVGIDPNHIPLHWQCNECGTKIHGGI